MSESKLKGIWYCMRKVFWDNPYQDRLVTKVASINGNQLLFEDTIAYSFSGAQESDKATINDLTVISSKKVTLRMYIFRKILIK